MLVNTRRLLPLVCSLTLISCAAVDQFGSRIEDANENSQRANDEETLLNIVRASKSRPLTFVAISQVAGGQTETLSTGLPTASFGPGQAAANHVYQITNSLSSQASGTYQSNPLVSTAFQTGMLAPISETILAYMVAVHPRETVLVPAIEAITFTVPKRPPYRLRNNPEGDRVGVDCASIQFQQVRDKQRYFSTCNYTLFLYYMEAMSKSGLTAELIDAPAAEVQSTSSPSPAASGKSGAAESKPPGKVGRFCFDWTRSNHPGLNFPACGEKKKSKMKKQTAAKESGPTPPLYFNVEGLGRVEITFQVRSPLAVYSYLGAQLRSEQPIWSGYQSSEANNLIRNEPFVNIVTGTKVTCFTSVVYDGERYCVPSSSRHTPALFDILQQLKNLSTSPSDLNAAFSVRLVGG